MPILRVEDVEVVGRDGQAHDFIMATVGYTVPWSATAGREVNLHLSSARPITQVTILRLDTPEPETQSWDIDPVDPQPGRRDLAAGSYVFVDSTDLKTLDRVRSIAFELYLTRNSGFRTIMKTASIGHLTQAGFSEMSEHTFRFARYEGFEAHANSVSRVRHM